MVCTVLAVLSNLVSRQSNATEGTTKRVQQFLDYLTTRPDAKVRYYVSDMVVNIHSDASYLSVAQVRKRFSGCYHGGSTSKRTTYQAEWKFFIISGIMKFVVTSAAKANLR